MDVMLSGRIPAPRIFSMPGLLTMHVLPEGRGSSSPSAFFHCFFEVAIRCGPSRVVCLRDRGRGLVVDEVVDDVGLGVADGRAGSTGQPERLVREFTADSLGCLAVRKHDVEVATALADGLPLRLEARLRVR